ncbi:GRP family sugar transporter [Apilactobacillus ozensis]|uniref:Ribose transporter n=1 Tax=Apilactobacillus ozensis DSM 23829 = JCM 17196 TaxID=1423781 RepID=A0A0R2APM2_9LACO|nr:GRP family sugar transporter [Apilactobacillus ozensis]KRM67716.1 ribose transporter [Apilactobacillus ozensis DSM 23829 = JCM 17196]MCK8607017.1 GRP family sugar transporter [Apilactobacillus ozensis]
MNILIGILPAFLWGIGPILATKLGGRPINQLVGTGYGQLIIGVVIYLFTRPTITFNDFIWAFIGGFAWSIAQLMQFTAFTKMNVSTAMPISTGLQLIEIPLAGVIFWGDWGTPTAKLFGFLSIALLILGTCFTSFRDGSVDRPKMDYKSGLFLLIVGSFGYTACSVFPKIPDASGLVGLLPQTIGMGLGGVVLGLFMQSKDHESYLFTRATMRGLIIGLLGGLGTLAYLTSLNLNGVATSFPLTQMNVVVSTLGGLLILHERKNKRELLFTILGLAMIIIAAVVISRLS